MKGIQMWAMEVPPNMTYSHHMCSSTDETRKVKNVQNCRPLTHISKNIYEAGLKSYQYTKEDPYLGPIFSIWRDYATLQPQKKSGCNGVVIP